MTDCRLLALLVHILMLFSCEKNPGSGQFIEDVSIACVLSTSQKRQVVQLYSTTNELDRPTDIENYFIKDAIVSIGNGEKETQFSYFIQKDSSLWAGLKTTQMYIDSPEKLQVIPGRTYSLIVQTEIVDIQGTTIIPAKPSIVYPLNSSIHTNDSLTVSWDGNHDTSWYILSIDPPDYFLDNWYITTPPLQYKTTSTLLKLDKKLFEETGHYVFERTGIYALVVKACDKNYYNSIYEGATASGITGNYGLFGSCTESDTVFFYYKMNE